jgi:hypothetical protein
LPAPVDNEAVAGKRVDLVVQAAIYDDGRRDGTPLGAGS